VIVAVKVVLGARLTVGVKVAISVAAAYVTVPATLVAPAFNANVEPVMVAGFIALLNAAVIIAELGQIGVALFGGVTSVTVGRVVAHDVEVVKVQTF
jgi:hypothetical protein